MAVHQQAFVTAWIKSLVGRSQNSSGAHVRIALLYFSVFGAHGVWRITFPNYAIEVVGLSQAEMGSLISATAIPGMLAGFTGLISWRSSATFVLLSSCLLVGLGLVVTGLSSASSQLLLGALLVSIGFIAFYPAANAVCIAQSLAEDTARQLGRLKSLGPLAGLAAAILILLVFAGAWYGERQPGSSPSDTDGWIASLASALGDAPGFDPVRMRPWMIGLGLLAALVGVVVTRRSTEPAASGLRGGLRLRRALWPYYSLNFLAGCRSGLFQAYVLYAMIHDYGLRIHGTALLVLAGHAMGFGGYRIIGHLTSTHTPAAVLAGLYGIVAVVFGAFAYVIGVDPFGPALTLTVLASLFLVDSAVFGASVATDAHLKRISAPNRYLGDIAAGLSMFYVGVATAPQVTRSAIQLVGAGTTGDVWTRMTPFLIGCLLALTAIVLSQHLDGPAGSGRTTESTGTHNHS